MKQTILKLGATVFFVVGSITFIGCGNSDHNESEEHSHGEVAEVQYQCPMKCENEKTYTEPGSCPICGMDLTEKKSLGNDGHQHKH